MFRIIEHINPIIRRSNVGLILFAIFALGGCSLISNVEKPPVDCKDNVNCYAEKALTQLAAIGSDINYWSNLLTYAMLASICFATIATVMIALQGDNNKHWTRPIGLIATTFGAAATTLISTFHVQDNIDKLIEIRSKVVNLTNNLERDVRGKNKDQIDDLLWQYTSEYNKLMEEKTKLKGSAGRLNIGPAPPVPSSPQSK